MAIVVAVTLGFGSTAAFGGIQDTIEIDGNMKDDAMRCDGGTRDTLPCTVAGDCPGGACVASPAPDWCSLVAGPGELYSGILGDCGQGDGDRICEDDDGVVAPCCAPQADCAGDLRDRFFTGGGSKDKQAISCDDGANACWKHEIETGGPNDKTNIYNGAVALLIDPTNGHKILAFMGDLKAENGTAEIGVWLLVNSGGPICDPDEGLWDGRHDEEDVQILASFTRGGRVGTVTYRTIQTVNADGSIVFDDDDGVAPPAGDAAAAINVEAIPAEDSCWPYQNKFESGGNDAPYNVHPPTTFFSAAIDLTDLFLDRCFTTFVLQTRTSQSTPATYKDFMVGSFDTCRDICGTKEAAACPSCEDASSMPLDELCASDADPATLSNWSISLFEDADADGCPDAGELVTVDGNGDPLANPVTTDSSGAYTFTDLPQGADYIVCETVRDDCGAASECGANISCEWTPCSPFDGCPDDVDAGCSASCAARNLNCYPAVTLDEDQCNGMARDFRNIPIPDCADVNARKYCDEDGDGVNDVAPDDPFIPGFCLVLTEADGSQHCGVTNAAGVVTFGDIEQGQDVTVHEDLDGSDCEDLGCGSADNSAGWVLTTASSRTQTVDEDPELIQPDFGNTSIPTIDCGTDDVSLNNDPGLCSAEFCFTPTATNLCGGVTIECDAGDVVLFAGATEGELCGVFPAGCPETTTVTCVATTDAGQTADCEFDVSVTDNEDPVATCGDDAEFECPHTIVFDPCQFSDNCGYTPASSIAMLPAECPYIEIQKQTCSAEDPCGNSDSCSQTIKVKDTTPPTIDCPADDTLECPATPNFGTPTCDDLCQDCEVRLKSDNTTGDACSNTRTKCWDAVDDCENASDECCQSITVEDTTPPTITDPVDKTIDCTVPPTFDPPTCSDDCVDCTVRMTSDGGPGGNCGGTLTRCWVADDDCGNTSREVCQTITITDTTAPTITCPGDQELTCGVPFDFTPDVNDDCDPNPSVECHIKTASDLSRVSLVDNGDGSFTVTISATATATIECTATDECDNTSTPCEFDIAATCNQACSPGYWKNIGSTSSPNHGDEWCEAGFQPLDNFCENCASCVDTPPSGPATTFNDAWALGGSCPGDNAIDAFIAGGGTVEEALNVSPDKILFHCDAALLDAAHPDVSDGSAGVAALQGLMADLCDNTPGNLMSPVAVCTGKSSDRATLECYCSWLISLENEGGCPLN